MTTSILKSNGVSREQYAKMGKCRTYRRLLALRWLQKRLVKRTLGE